MNKMNKVITHLWRMFLFAFPFSFNFVLYDNLSYRSGNFSPWTTGFLFLPEILLFTIFTLQLSQDIREKNFPKNKKWDTGWLLSALFLINAGVVTLIKGDVVIYLFFLLRIIEAWMVFWLLRKKILPTQEAISWLLYGAVFQIVLAYLQTRFNHSLGLSIIGEPTIGPNMENVAKNLYKGERLIRPYGTFLHPNLLGAYLMTVLLVSLAHLKKAAIPFWTILLCVGIYLTDSQAAEIALVTTIFLLFIFHKIKLAIHKKQFSLCFLALFVMVNLGLLFTSSSLSSEWSSIQERLSQNVISLNMFLHHFWGVGVGHFTIEMENFSSLKLLPWEFQPVHNTYFLILNETGLQGFILLVLILAYFLQHYWRKDMSYFLKDKLRFMPLLALLIIASFDHLLWTSWVGPILTGIAFSEAKN